MNQQTGDAKTGDAKTGDARTGRHTYAAPMVRTAWLDRTREVIIEPELPIIDPHHHLWHARAGAENYLLDDLAADLASGHNVLATVFMQCAWSHRTAGPPEMRPVGETEAVAATAVLFATGAYGRARACAGIVGYADLRLDALDAVLDAHLAAGGGRFRGIRQIAAWHEAIEATSSVPPPPGLLQDPAFLRGVKRLGERGLSFDSWNFHTQLGDLLGVARAAPETVIVVDHLGGPLGVGPYRGQRDAVFAAWHADMRALAACPNVQVKLGGLAMAVNGFDYHEGKLPPDSARLASDWAPWMEACIALFGPARCMFESNFPVDKGMCSYPVVWNAFKRIASGASAAEKAMLFHDTAARVYRMHV